MNRYPTTVLALVAIAAPLSAAMPAPPPPLLPTSVLAALADLERPLGNPPAAHLVE